MIVIKSSLIGSFVKLLVGLLKRAGVENKQKLLERSDFLLKSK